MATLKESLFSLSGTLADTIKMYKERGILLAEESKANNRINTCVNCPELSDAGICGKCGCVMKVKVRLEAAHCPMSKW
jgi:hypothetical protein